MPAAPRGPVQWAALVLRATSSGEVVQPLQKHPVLLWPDTDHHLLPKTESNKNVPLSPSLLVSCLTPWARLNSFRSQQLTAPESALTSSTGNDDDDEEDAATLAQLRGPFPHSLHLWDSSLQPVDSPQKQRYVIPASPLLSFMTSSGDFTDDIWQDVFVAWTKVFIVLSAGGCVDHFACLSSVMQWWYRCHGYTPKVTLSLVTFFFNHKKLQHESKGFRTIMKQPSSAKFTEWQFIVYHVTNDEHLTHVLRHADELMQDNLFLRQLSVSFYANICFTHHK